MSESVAMIDDLFDAPFEPTPQSRHYELWSDEETDQLRALIPQKLAAREIGQRIGRTESSVLTRAQRLGLRFPKRRSWLEEDVETLRTLAATRMSGTEIGAILGKTRNAVLGQAARSGLKLNSTARQNSRSPGRNVRLPKPKVAKAIPEKKPPPRLSWLPSPIMVPQRSVMAPESAPTPPEGTKTFLQLQPGDCKFPYGDPRDWDTFRFCGVHTDVRPYCAEHRRQAYQVKP